MIKRYLTSLVYGLSIGLFCSFSAMATVCFLPDGSCGGVNYGYKDGSGSTCTYKTRAEATLKKGECEEVQKQGFCFYLVCSMSKSDCDKAAENAPNHDKCCVPCGNCWKVDDCSIPDIPTCKGAGYETEQTCKNQNLGFEPNGKFDKNGTACGKCKDSTYITCPEMGDDYVTRAECTAKGSSFTFASANVKDSGGNECGTCDPSVNCPSGYEPAATADCDTSKGFYRYTNSNYPNCIQCQCRNQGIINGYCTSCSAEGYEPRSSLPPGLDCNIQCPLDSSYVKADECTETPCPTGYTRGLTSIHMCSYQNGQSATSIEYNGYSGAAPCGKCVYEECKPKDCSGYTYTTLSDYANSESCDLGCNQGKKYRCKSGYTYSNGKCVIVPITITINYSLTIGYSGGAPGAGTGWLDMVFNVSSASDAKAHNVLLTFNPMDGAEVTNCTISYPLTIGSNSKTKVQCGQHYSMMNTPELTNVMIDNTNVVSAVRLDQLSKVSVKNDKYIIKFVQKTKLCTPTCTSETNCQYGSKTESDGCGGTCTVCYPACKPGYWYGKSNATLNCYVRPITGYLKQIGNPNCLKCICNGSQRDPATGKLIPCAYI